MESRSTHIKNMICWIGMISVSAYCILAFFVVPLFVSYGELPSGLVILIHIGDAAEVARYSSAGVMAIIIGILSLFAGGTAIAWMVLTFLRKDIAGPLNVVFAGFNTGFYFFAAIYFSVSSNYRVSAGAWISWVLSGAGLFFAIWALVINKKYGCGYLGRCPGFGRDYYTNRGYGGSNYGGKPYHGAYGGNAGGYGGYGGSNYGGYDDRTVAGGYVNNNGSIQQRGRSSGRISVVGGPCSGSAVPAGDGQRIAIGRMQGECRLVLPDNAISRVHCYITFHASSNMYSVVDVSSSGVFDQNRRPIAKNREVLMAPGARLSIGNATVLQLG